MSRTANILPKRSVLEKVRSFLLMGQKPFASIHCGIEAHSY
jgi:hypothetical protein